jgi:anti-anti-sigma factor
MQSDFLVETHTSGHAATLAVSGELDLVAGPVLERALAPPLDSDVELIVIDLRGLEFMDSTGLHVLIKAHQRMHEEGRRLALVRAPKQVQRLFDLTGLTDGLTIVDSPEEALEVDQAPG